MKKIKYNIIVLGLLLSAVTAFSQVPGYMGRRFIVGYETYIGPSFVYPYANSTEDKTLGLNSVHCLDLEYMIKPRTAMCLTVQYGKTGMPRRDYDLYDPVNDMHYTVGYYTLDKKPIQLKTTNISLGFKFFSRGSFAPVGRYRKLEFLLITGKIQYDPDAFYTSDDRIESEHVSFRPGTGEYLFKSAGFAYTIGKERVLWDRMTLDVGVRFAVVAGPFLDAFSDVIPIYNSNVYNNSFEGEMRSAANERLFGAQAVNIHIGIGFLAF